MISSLLKRAGSRTNAEGLFLLFQDVGYDWLHLSEYRERVLDIFGSDADAALHFLHVTRLVKQDSGCYFFTAKGPIPDLGDIYAAAENHPKAEEAVVWLSQPIKNQE